MIPLQDFQKRPRVLVAGGGLAALEAVARVMERGYETVLANPAESLRPVRSLQASDQPLNGYENELLGRLGKQPQCLYFEKTHLKRLSGFAGDFQAELQSDKRTWIEAVGAVVLAPELNAEGPEFTVPPGESRQRMNLDQVVEALLSPAEASAAFPALGPDSYVALVIGLNGSGGLAEMAQALNGALKIKEDFGSQVYFFTGNIKVAEEGLERFALSLPRCRGDLLQV